MDLFIDTSQRVQERREREPRTACSRARTGAAAGGAANRGHRVARSAHANCDFDLDEAQGYGDTAEDADASLCGGLAEDVREGRRSCHERRVRRSRGRRAAQGTSAPEGYSQELAYDRKRARRRRCRQLVRAVALVIAIPFALAAAFLISYALTCILNGASPEELVEMMGELFARIDGFVRDAAAAV